MSLQHPPSPPPSLRRCAAAATQLQLRAGFAAGAPPEIKPNPLQQIVPPIIKGMRATVDGEAVLLRA